VAANKEFSIREQAFLRSQLDVLPRRLLLPQLTQELDGRWIKVGELCIRANLRREVRPCLGVNPAQSLVRHRHQRVTGTHPIRAAVMPGRSQQPSWHVHDQDAVPFVPILLNGDPVSKPLEEARLSASGLVKRTRAHDRARTPISHAEDDLASSFIGECDAVLG
jgi:hypothetical protein